MRLGYLVDVSKKKPKTDSWLSDIGPREKVICSDKKLVEMIQRRFTYTVWSAHWIDVDRYLENHPDEEIEVLGFEEI